MEGAVSGLKSPFKKNIFEITKLESILFKHMYKRLFDDKDVDAYLLDHPNILQQWVENRRFYNRFVKRFIDFLLALLLSILLLPLFIFAAVGIKLTSPGPIMYRGVRGAYGGGSFRIFKFRSMFVNAEQIGGGTTALNDPRITPFGSFLRKTKLDETPQLFNILRGDMSFVGPRPELLQYTEMYQGIEKLILKVRPGITDVSSLIFINLDEMVGGSDADRNYEQRVLKRKNLLRIGYVLFQSPVLDLRLFLLTLVEVFSKLSDAIFNRQK